MIIKTDPDEIQNYLVDAANVKGYCDAVYIPETAEEISQILKKANKDKTPVTISGNGTGLTGARVPFGGIVISTERMNRIIEINSSGMYAVVEPGVILSDLLNILKENNLLYPPDPTEKNCFIGGTVATNASGEKTFKYGPTRDYVLELQIVLADGEILNLKRGENKADGYNMHLTGSDNRIYNFEIPSYQMPPVKNASGYYCKEYMDAIDLFIGSEGTLGVITKIKLKLLPYTQKILSCVIFFDDEKNALLFIIKAREMTYQNRRKNNKQQLDALALEFFDGNALKFLRNDYSQIPHSAKAGVWFEQEVSEETEEMLFNEWMQLISGFNGDEESAWFAFNEADVEKIKLFRHAISAKVNEYISKNNFKKLGTDVAVPDNKFEDFYHNSKEMVKQSGLDFVVYGHFGNSHIHLNMLPGNDEEYEKGKLLYKAICSLAVSLGGTVSAEHGIGKLKPDYLLEMYGEETIKKMAALKRALDPNLILGIGNIIDTGKF